jgi:hypothetical protein
VLGGVTACIGSTQQHNAPRSVRQLRVYTCTHKTAPGGVHLQFSDAHCFSKDKSLFSLMCAHCPYLAHGFGAAIVCADEWLSTD